MLFPRLFAVLILWVSTFVWTQVHWIWCFYAVEPNRALLRVALYLKGFANGNGKCRDKTLWATSCISGACFASTSLGRPSRCDGRCRRCRRRRHRLGQARLDRNRSLQVQNLFRRQKFIFVDVGSLSGKKNLTSHRKNFLICTLGFPFLWELKPLAWRVVSTSHWGFRQPSWGLMSIFKERQMFPHYKRRTMFSCYLQFWQLEIWILQPSLGLKLGLCNLL